MWNSVSRSIAWATKASSRYNRDVYPMTPTNAVGVMAFFGADAAQWPRSALGAKSKSPNELFMRLWKFGGVSVL